MILSASRRTDIPAFYGSWMLRRLQEGFVRVRNPFRPRQVREISLSPDVVDCIVFWTKNIGPFLEFLPEIQKMGYSVCIQHTLTPYGTDLEPGLPSKRLLLEQLRCLGTEIGPDRIAWRYDPIIVDAAHPVLYHLEQFDRMCRLLKGSVSRCFFSFLDLYPSRMQTRKFLPVREEDMHLLAAGLSKSAAQYGIPLFTCAEEISLEKNGISHGACIDPVWISQLSNKTVPARKDPNQRPSCGCAESIDIGAYGSCPHRCAYCYASGNRMLNRLFHDPDSPFLLGSPDPADQISQLPKKPR